jgi:hypothetical protein
VRLRATDGERDYVLALAKGDRVRLFKSTGAVFVDGKVGNIGRNGLVMEVVNADKDALVLQNKNGREGRGAVRDISKGRRLWLAYGDAMTIHTAQGSTSREHIVALPSGSRVIDGLLGYSASTRHRQANYLVTSETAETAEARRRRPLHNSRVITREDEWANVARVLAWQLENDTATALMERVGRLKRGTVRPFRRSWCRRRSGSTVRRRRRWRHEIGAERREEMALQAVVTPSGVDNGGNEPREETMSQRIMDSSHDDMEIPVGWDQPMETYFDVAVRTTGAPVGEGTTSRACAAACPKPGAHCHPAGWDECLSSPQASAGNAPRSQDGAVENPNRRGVGM